jgi:hypothetical protein
MHFHSIFGKSWPWLALLIFPLSQYAGVTNPDLSAIGQVLGEYSNQPSLINAEEPTLKLGEAEIILDAYLNPYFKGALNLSGSEDGFALEEAYTTMVKGLPWGLGIKAGKYRLGFGKINPAHPHAYPFINPPRSLVALLPGGEDGFNETGVQVSDFLPMPGDWASTLSVDLIEGKQFHPNQTWTRMGWLGRWSNDFLLGEVGALETGLSVATGDDVAREWENVFIWGADIKAKFFLPGGSQLTLQGEAILNQGHFEDTALFVDQRISRQNRKGFVTFADYRYHSRYSGGLLFEQWDNSGLKLTTDKALRTFVGYAFMEETTLLRLGYERFIPEVGDGFDTMTLQLVFSMGPHKPHQF